MCNSCDDNRTNSGSRLELWTCSAGDKFNDYMVTNAIVSSDGTVLWMYPALIKTYCTLNVKYFPFDSQDCDIQFISWTHNGEQLDIFHNDTMKTAVYYASANQVSKVKGQIIIIITDK